MNIILFDPDPARDNLLPLTYTRPVAALRVGIDTIAEKWQSMLPGTYRYETQPYLRAKYQPFDPETSAGALYIAGNVVPDADLVAGITALKPGQALYSGSRLIARDGATEAERVEYGGRFIAIDMSYHLFLNNDRVMRADFERLTAQKPRREPSPTVTVIGDPANLFIAADAGAVEGCVINVSTGPVYIDSDAQVMEGACMRGPIALLPKAVVRMGAKVYGATTIGPFCKVGGELDNVVMIGLSNKAHDGYLGNAVIGEWCNLGGGATASNLKNDYTEIKLWNYPTRRFLRTGLTFCGLIMGDHSKVGVNAMLNTATTLGVGVNIHGSGFPRPFLASFSEGSTAGFNDVPMAKFFDIARRVMARRNVELTDADIDILNHVRELAELYR